MVQVINALGYSMVFSIFVLIAYAIIYFLLFLCGKILKKQLLNNTLLRILYILTSLPFLFCGLYIISLVFVLEYTPVAKMLIVIFGLFLIIYSIRRIIVKIKDIEYFGGIWWLSYILNMQLWILEKVLI